MTEHDPFFDKYYTFIHISPQVVPLCFSSVSVQPFLPGPGRRTPPWRSIA